MRAVQTPMVNSICRSLSMRFGRIELRFNPKWWGDDFERKIKKWRKTLAARLSVRVCGFGQPGDGESDQPHSGAPEPLPIAIAIFMEKRCATAKLAPISPGRIRNLELPVCSNPSIKVRFPETEIPTSSTAFSDWRDQCASAGERRR